MSCLPTEIITHEIFSKLPAISLLRFKCVSKSFNALISSTEFKQLHLRESRSSDANRLLILVGKDGRNLYSIDVDSPDSVKVIPLPRPTLDSLTPDMVSIFGSFDGLICVGIRHRHTFSKFKHFLINPSTGIFQEIPYYERPPTFLDTGIINEYRFSFGFGFDDLNHDYKLVGVKDIIEDIVYGFGVDRQVLRTSTREVIVYSLNQNSWKLAATVRNTIDLLMKKQNGVLIKNHLLHWVFSDSDSNDYRIGCFDIRSDNWAKDVPLMELTDHNNKKFHLRNLGVINGCLCLSTKVNRLLNVVWMMKEYGEKESWVTLFYIPQFITGFSYFQSIRPFFCLRRGSKYEVLVAKKEGNGLVWYDIRGFVWYDIRPRTYGREENIIRIPAFTRGCFFKGSLVQIQGGRLLVDTSTGEAK